MSQTANRSPESARRKFFMNSTYIMSRKQKSDVFWAQGGQVESNSQQLARIGEKKIFHELDVHHVQKVGIKRFLGSGGRNESNSHHQLALMGEKKIFHYLDVPHAQKVGIKAFLGSGGANESNSQQLARIGEKKIFHEPELHHVQKVGIKRFWPHELKLSLTANSSHESAGRKFFMNPTYIISRKQESNVFGVMRSK